jgi:hypothetical protein
MAKAFCVISVSCNVCEEAKREYCRIRCREQVNEQDEKARQKLLLLLGVRSVVVAAATIMRRQDGDTSCK